MRVRLICHPTTRAYIYIDKLMLSTYTYRSMLSTWTLIYIYGSNGLKWFFQLFVNHNNKTNTLDQVYILKCFFLFVMNHNNKTNTLD